LAESQQLVAALTAPAKPSAITATGRIAPILFINFLLHNQGVLVRAMASPSARNRIPKIVSGCEVQMRSLRWRACPL
jgi:hypothetical protein